MRDIVEGADMLRDVGQAEAKLRGAVQRDALISRHLELQKAVKGRSSRVYWSSFRSGGALPSCNNFSGGAIAI